MKADNRRRYARHIVLSEIGEAGQEKLLQSSVLVVGAGGLGAASIGYLAAMGVGRIGIIDHDRVELSNLQRQTLYETGDIDRLKVEAARDRVHEINPECRVETYPNQYTSEKCVITDYHVILDGTDNFDTRFALHAASYRAKKTLISAAISAFAGQLSTFKAYLGAPHPCYHCFIPGKPEREITCAQEGIIGSLAGVMGSLQALEAVKELLGIGSSMSGYILSYDALTNDFKRLNLPRDPHCTFCASAPLHPAS